jgi:hypothetical protein
VGIYEIKKPKKINSFSVTLFLIVVVGGYLLYWYIPAWWPIFQIKGIMSGTCNDAYRQMDNDKLLDKMLKETKRTGLKLTKQNFELERERYTPAELVGLDEKKQDLMQRRGKTCRLTFRYKNNYEMPFIGKSVPLSWTKTVESELGIIKY